MLGEGYALVQGFEWGAEYVLELMLVLSSV